MQGGRGVKIVIFMALRCKVMENTRKMAGAWGKSFSGPPRGPEEQRTYVQRTRLDARRLRIRSSLHTDSMDLIRRTRVTLVPSAGPFVVVLVIPNLTSQN